MADPGDVQATVTATLSDESLAQLSAAIVKAVELGFIGGASAMNNKFSGPAAKQIAKLQAQVKKLMAGTGAEFTKTAGSASAYGKSLNVVQRNILDLVAATKALKDSSTVIAQTLRRDSVAVQRSSVERNQAEARASNERVAILRNEGKLAAIQAQTTGQRVNTAARQAGQQRLQIMRAVIDNIARLEKGFGVTVKGIASTTVSVLSRASSTIGRTLTRSNSQFTQGLSSSMTQRESIMRSSFARQENIVRASILRQERQVQELRRLTSTGVAGAVTGRGVGGGLLAGAGAGIGVGALLRSGFERFSELERLNKQFLALTGSIEDTNLLMDEVKEFAKKTPFDLVGVAGLAKGFLAIGTEAKDVLPQVSAIADAVALTGGGTEQLDRIQRAIGQVVSTGKLQGDELNQLAENLPGLNIRKILADQLTGGDVAALVEMQAAGEITGELFVQGLITGLQQDERLVGASEDLATTLSGRLANLKESFADLGASVIGLIAGPLKSLFRGLNTGFANTAALIRGEGLSAALQVLRSALFGAASGLGAVLAAKGALEVFRLLAATVPLILSPLGLLVVSAALVGAGLNALRKRSEPLRQTLGLLGDRFVEIGGKIGDLFRPAVEAISQFIDRTLVPSLDRLAQFLANNLVGAFDATVRFITGPVVDGFRTVAEYVDQTLIPVLTEIGREVVDTFTVGLDVAKRFGSQVATYLKPAIDGFAALGSALGAGGLATVAAGLAGFAVGGPIVGAALAGITLIGTSLAGLFTGDLSDIGSGLGSAASGVATVLSGLAGTIREKLAPVAQEVIDFLAGVFSGPNLLRIAEGFLGVVEQIGFILGNIVSDPRFVTAVAAVVAAAVIVGAKFIQGFARGVLDNLSPVFSLIGNALKRGLQEAFDPEVIGLALVAAFAFTTILRPLIASFRRTGESGAGGFLAGFKSKVTSGVSNIGGFLSGASGKATTFGPMLADAKTFQRELLVVRNQLRVLGSDFKLNPGNLAAARTEVDRITAGLTKAQIAGLQFRDRIGAAMTAVTTVITGGRGVLRGIGQIGKAFFDAARTAVSSFSGVRDVLRTGLGGSAATNAAALAGTSTGKRYGQGFVTSVVTGMETVKTAVSTSLTQLRAIAQSQGTTLGRLLGRNLASGALAAFGGFQAGKFEGQAGGSGLIAAVGTGLTAGLATGNVAVGALAAGTALLGAAFGRSGKQAEEFRQKVSALADSIASELTTAVDNGTVSLKQLGDGLDFSDVAGFDAIREEFESLDPAIKKALVGLKVNFDRDLLPVLKEAGTDVNDLKIAILDAAKAGGAFDKIVKVDDPLDKTGPQISVSSMEQYKAFFDFINGEYRDLTAVQQHYIDSLDAETLRVVLSENGEAWEVLSAAISEARDNAILFGEDPAMKDWVGDIKHGRDELAILSRGFQRMQTDAAAEHIAAGILDMKSNLEAANLAGGTFDATVDRIFAPRDATGFTESINAAILSLRGAFEDNVVGGDLFQEAALDEQFASVGETFANAVRKGIDENQIFNEASLREKTLPLAAALLDQITDPAAREAIIAFLEESYAAAAVEINPQTVNFDGNNLSVESIPVGLDLSDAVIDTTEANRIIASANLAGIPVGLDLTDAEVSATDVSRIASDSRAAMVRVGDAMGDGAVQGLNNSERRILARADAIASNVVGRFTRQFEISSPSKVMIRIGEFIGEGLAIGITNSIPTVTAAANALGSGFNASQGSSLGGGIGEGLAKGIADALKEGLEDGIDQATIDVTGLVDDLLQKAFGGIDETIGKIATAVREATVGLFEGLTGGDAKTGPFGTPGSSLATAQAAVTQGMQSFLSTFDSNAATIFEVNAKKLEELSAAEREIFGENLFSINPADVLGSSNLAALTSAFDEIASLGSVLLSQGKPASEVTKTLEGYVDQLVLLATNLGFSQTDILTLVDALGLSDSALANFIKQLEELNRVAGQVPSVPTPLPSDERTSRLPRPAIFGGAPDDRFSSNPPGPNGPYGVRDINVTLPSGDPTANALAIANAIAYAGSLP